MCVKWDACAIHVLNGMLVLYVLDGMHTMKCTRSGRYKQAVVVLYVC